MSKAPPVEILRRHAEDQFAEELEQLAAVDDRQRPPSWKLSPWAVVTYLLGVGDRCGRVSCGAA